LSDNVPSDFLGGAEALLKKSGHASGTNKKGEAEWHASGTPRALSPKTTAQLRRRNGRSQRYTIVAACINADTGVGPSIASGNHVCKPI
jgi:hypothetical protein